jgi:hypothetical protein
VTASFFQRGGTLGGMSEPRSYWFSMAGVAVLAAAVYANTLAYGPAWDAEPFVSGSGAMEGLAAVPDMLTRPFLKDQLPGQSPYRPLTAVS